LALPSFGLDEARCGTEFPRQGLAGLALHVGQHHLAAIVDDHPRRTGAKARRAAGDDEYAVPDLHAVFPRYRV
jgi:hypothetical protein